MVVPPPLMREDLAMHARRTHIACRVGGILLGIAVAVTATALDFDFDDDAQPNGWVEDGGQWSVDQGEYCGEELAAV